MQNTLYVTTTDLENHTHFYRLPLTETVPVEHEIVNVRPAGVFRLSSLLTPDEVQLLNAIK